MIKDLNKNSYLLYSTITIVLAVFLTVGIIWAWTEPTSAPPGGNVLAPLNTGPDGQAKEGGLLLATGSGITNGLIVQNGNVGIGTTSPGARLHVQDDGAHIKLSGGTYTSIDMMDGGTGDPGYLDLYREGVIQVRLSPDISYFNTGNVGIGTTNPTEKLSVNGVLDMMNHKIKNVSEIDPVFGIQGKKYVSYMPDFIGQKVEVVGKARLEGDKLEIDLDKEPESSDLWLFWQVIDHQSVISFVSPQDNASLYAYIEGSKFVIKLRQGEQGARFSYYLVGTRLDHADDTDNLYDDQNVQYFIDIDSLRK